MTRRGFPIDLLGNLDFYSTGTRTRRRPQTEKRTGKGEWRCKAVLSRAKAALLAGPAAQLFLSAHSGRLKEENAVSV